jgi:hypothetical protein
MSDSQRGLRDRWTRGEIVFFLGVGVVCLAVLTVIGKMSTPGMEEWDTPLFLQLLLPIAAIGAFLGGFLFPGHSWRWGVAPWWMQYVYMLWRHGPGNIWPIAIVFWALAFLPFVALAKLGASISGYTKRKASDRKVNVV